MTDTWDVAIIGGGASGLAAAICSAHGGDRVLLLEAQSRVGKKVLATGNGRCNITNTNAAPQVYRADCSKRIEEIFALVPPAEVTRFLSSVGIDCFEERDGRVYPRSEQASAVLDMLRLSAEHLGVMTICDARVTSIRKREGRFCISAGASEYSAKHVIIACGSPAAPQLGGCSDGKKLLEGLGHTVRRLNPALTQILVDSPHTRSLKGVRLRCTATLTFRDKTVFSDSGELQINDGALSGIVIFQLSSRLARLDARYAGLAVDLMPECTREQLLYRLTDRREKLGYLPCEQLLAGLLHKRAACCLMKDAGITALACPAAKISDEQLKHLAQLIKCWPFRITGLAGWKQAQICSGGASLAQFDEHLQSTICKGLYACGEVLDCDGDCGGFNLHWAWCTGILAGRSASESKRKN